MYNVTAVLLDTVSIQRYVFSSNELKINIGASYIVSNIYKKYLEEALKEQFSTDINLKLWKEKPEEVLIKNEGVDFEIGYIGGGNAFLLFKRRDLAEGFVRSWTKLLLRDNLGISTAVAIVEDFDLDDVQKSMDKLFCKMSENKSLYFPNVTFSKYGITEDCPYTGLTAEIYDEDEGRYISSVAYKKLKYADEAQEYIKKCYKEALGENFIFTRDVEKLGQQKNDNNHIAIIHIDGNSMGQKFRETKDLVKLRKLSIEVDSVVKKSITALFKEARLIAQKLVETPESNIKIGRENGKFILPIRPLLIEGDDITLISEGRLGIFFAKRLLEILSSNNICGEPMTACAGVAIIKTKYPFYRGYTLAEELCKNAKKKAREYGGTSWLDFFIAYSGISGSLSDIRERQYKRKDWKLNFGPYLVAYNGRVPSSIREKEIKHLINGVKHFKKWPRSIVKEFQTKLATDKEAVEKFVKRDMKIKGYKLFEVPGNSYDTSGIANDVTPYFDMIELMEYYPDELFDLDEVVKEGNEDEVV
ncbi:hypothetical protein SAMN02746089_01939 [Caldanaerobius fijiensis DSM 17918]|uniref:CRISPR-associated protein Cas10/Cmr2, subtype III-B n=1 Tax=Caldanaerobius fijiensis DSM 17918 TaxID=1121256 RepID=A0A1M5BRC8_9THEO|nr:hypothetical protein [Caldanaerobius fijiensis]SHF44976.1 hypothetical protein SAMN02746089_01939 [Caldanaerobius fijiensis DSM 17918]